MNPAPGTLWKHYLPSGISRFKVKGAWGKGVRDSYQVIAYELKYDQKDDIVYMSSAKMAQLIKSKTIEPI